MTIYQILSLLGVGGIIGAMWKYSFNFMKELRTENQAQKLGIQALLRAQMITEFNYWSERGYCPIWARQNFENLWVQYEALGQNGVMSDIHKKFLDLPIKEKEAS